MWQLEIDATNASSGSTHAGFDQGFGTDVGAGDAGTVTPPSNVHVCSREYRPFTKSSGATLPLQVIVATYSAMPGTYVIFA